MWEFVSPVIPAKAGIHAFDPTSCTDIFVQIFPIGIERLDQLDLPFPPPPLYAFFTQNRRLGVLMCFEVHESIDTVTSSKAWYELFLVLPDSLDE